MAVVAREEPVRATEVTCRGLPDMDEQGARMIGGDFNLCPAALGTWDEEAWRENVFHTMRR